MGLVEELDKDDGENMDYDKIIKIAGQLHNAGCNPKSSEMKQIETKLKQHVNNLKAKTGAMGLTVDSTDDLITIKDTMDELDTINKFGAFMPDIKTDANEC